MSQTPEKVENLRKAIAVVTAAQTDQRSEAEDDLLIVIGQFLEEDDGHGDIGAFYGLVSLATILLIKLEKATGTRPEETLQQIAQRYTT